MRNQSKINRLAGHLALCAVVVMLTFLATQALAKGKPKVLVFSKTSGFHHNSIAVAVPAIQKLGADNGFDVDTTTDAAKFNDKNLKQYAAVIFVSTTGEFFKEDSQKQALKNYIEHGGGFVGIHAASDGMYDWQWYGDLVGAYFKAHPAPQMATLNVVDSTFVATKHLPRVWKRKDEWYHFKWVAKDLHVLINFDESSIKYKDDAEAARIKMGPNHPMAWYHDFDGGRSFYTELGHTDESYADPLYLQHILGGIEYAMGKKVSK